MFGRNNDKKISILATDQSIDTNRTRMEHLSLKTVTIGSKYLAIGSAQLGEKLIVESNQASTYIERRGHDYWDFLFGSHKSGNKMSVDFGRLSVPGLATVTYLTGSSGSLHGMSQ